MKKILGFLLKLASVVVMIAFLIAVGPVLGLFGLGLVFQSIHVGVSDPAPETITLDYISYEYRPFDEIELPWSEKQRLIDLGNGYHVYLAQGYISREIDLIFMTQKDGVNYCSDVKTIEKNYVFKKHWKYWPLAGHGNFIDDVDVTKIGNPQVSLKFTPADQDFILFISFIGGLLCACIGVLFSCLLVQLVRDTVDC